MKFMMSPNISVRPDNYPKAMDFYSKVLGFENRSNDQYLGDFDANPLNMYVIKDIELGGMIMELFVEDLETTRDYLVKKWM